MFVCTKCDAQFPKWAGRCPECQAWGTVQEESDNRTVKQVAPGVAKAGARLSASDAAHTRLATGISEMDRVLGGGIVNGSLVLLSGEPGIGKSTLVAAIAAAMPDVLYVSGEESAPQLAARFTRLGKPFDRVEYLEAEPVETIVASIEKRKPALAVIDSIQTIPSTDIESGAGSPTLVRYAANALLQCAKRTGVPTLVIGQVTKDGAVAGPKTLEHLVDVVLSLEGDPVHAFRLLRASKNRFGSTDEIGVFEMAKEGLVPVPNPSERFLAERVSVPGSVVTAVLEGSRVFLVEVQALVEKSVYGTPVRRASGFDANRLQMLTAILSKRAGLKLGDQDVYVNVIGGMELAEPAADLAVCAAITSAAAGHADARPVIYLGEVGLGGEVRSVPALERRLTEAGRLGIAQAMIPKKNAPKTSTLELHGIASVNELL